MEKRANLNRMARFPAALMTALTLLPLSARASGNGEQGALIRLDDEGCLYDMDCTEDDYGPEVMDAMRKIGYADPGSSVFCTHNPEGGSISCRRNDLPVPAANRLQRDGLPPPC